MSKRALIVIDVQNDYFPGGVWALPAAVATLPKIQRLIERARERQEPVVFIQHVTPPGAPVFAKGSHGGELHAELDVRPDDPLFTKAHPSSFQDTGLQDYLQRNDILALDVCGFMTQMCCDTTTREAYARGYKVRFFQDACAAKDLVVGSDTIPHDVVHKASLGALARFAQIVSTDEAD
ncbi:MAG TPA: cysteine hydrolase family protein [bacterium]|nr:cysteine hydrolase family protein [bacterium]